MRAIPIVLGLSAAAFVAIVTLRGGVVPVQAQAARVTFTETIAPIG